MIKYAIWDKQSPIFTPSGEVFTAEQWIEKYPIAAFDSIDVICSAGEINGAIFGTLGQMVEMYQNDGADFSTATTAQEKLQIIHEFDLSKMEKSKEAAQLAQQAEANAVSNAELTATSLASIAASMEYQNMMTLEDVEV